jgi:hypothetical protein
MTVFEEPGFCSRNCCAPRDRVQENLYGCGLRRPSAPPAAPRQSAPNREGPAIRILNRGYVTVVILDHPERWVIRARRPEQARAISISGAVNSTLWPRTSPLPENYSAAGLKRRRWPGAGRTPRGFRAILPFDTTSSSGSAGIACQPLMPWRMRSAFRTGFTWP